MFDGGMVKKIFHLKKKFVLRKFLVQDKVGLRKFLLQDNVELRKFFVQEKVGLRKFSPNILFFFFKYNVMFDGEMVKKNFPLKKNCT